MEIKPPLDVSGHIGSLTLKNGVTTVYLTGAVCSDGGRLLHAFSAITPTQKSLESVAQSLRDGDSMQANMLSAHHGRDYDRYDPITRSYPEVVTVHERYVYRVELAGKGKDFALDRINCGVQTWEMVMYPVSSRISATDANYVLLLDHEWSDERKMHYIFDSFNTRLAIPLSPDWIPSIWDQLQRINCLEQLHSFGRMVGFKITLDELAIRRFISHEIRSQRMVLPGLHVRHALAA